MHLFSILSSIAALASLQPILAQTTPTSYYETTYSARYSDGGASVDILTCGAQLAAEGYTTIGSIGSNIAGFVNVTSPNSSLCGECFVLEYAGAFLNIIVVDTASDGFVTTQAAYDNWVGSLAGQKPIPPSVDARVLGGPSNC